MPEPPAGTIRQHLDNMRFLSQNVHQGQVSRLRAIQAEAVAALELLNNADRSMSGYWHYATQPQIGYRRVLDPVEIPTSATSPALRGSRVESQGGVAPGRAHTGAPDPAPSGDAA